MILVALADLPNVIETMLRDTSTIEAVAKKYAQSRDMMFIGRQLHAPIVYEGSLKLKEVRARKAPVILLTTEDSPGAYVLADDALYMPKVHPILQPIIATIPLQLFAYYVGVARDFDVDQPRNLAKSVTVE